MSRWVAGLLILLAGVIGLLNGFGIVEMSLGAIIADFWPIILILVGLSIIISSKGYISGGIVAFLGLVFLNNNLELFTLDFSLFWSLFWPVIIILIGARIIIGHKSGESRVAIMGGIEKKGTPWKLESGNYQAILGGVELDLSSAEFTDKVITLELTAILGGIDITVPNDVAVSCQGTALFGGLEIFGRGSGGIFSNLKSSVGDATTAEKILNLNCNIILGGIEIKRQGE